MTNIPPPVGPPATHRARGIRAHQENETMTTKNETPNITEVHRGS